MKNLVIIVVVLLLSVSTFAMSKVTKTNNFEKTELSLLAGVESANKGLLVSSASLLGELKSEKAVIPLMNVLRSSKNEAERISAAQALVKIGDARGVYAVKKAAEFDESKRVRDLCSKFYFQSLLSNS